MGREALGTLKDSRKSKKPFRPQAGGGGGGVGSIGALKKSRKTKKILEAPHGGWGGGYRELGTLKDSRKFLQAPHGALKDSKKSFRPRRGASLSLSLSPFRSLCLSVCLSLSLSCFFFFLSLSLSISCCFSVSNEARLQGLGRLRGGGGRPFAAGRQRKLPVQRGLLAVFPVVSAFRSTMRTLQEQKQRWADAWQQAETTYAGRLPRVRVRSNTGPSLHYRVHWVPERERNRYRLLSRLSPFLNTVVLM